MGFHSGDLNARGLTVTGDGVGVIECAVTVVGGAVVVDQ